MLPTLLTPPQVTLLIQSELDRLTERASHVSTKQLYALVPAQIRQCPLVELETDNLDCPKQIVECRRLCQIGVPIACESVMNTDYNTSRTNAEAQNALVETATGMYYFGTALKLAHNVTYGLNCPYSPNLSRYEFVLQALPLIQDRGLLWHTCAWIIGQILLGLQEHTVYDKRDLIRAFPPKYLTLARKFQHASQNPSNAFANSDRVFLQIVAAEIETRKQVATSTRVRLFRERKIMILQEVSLWEKQFKTTIKKL